MSLYDSYGKPIVMHRDDAKPGSRARDLRQRISSLNAWRNSYNPLRSLTISRAVGLLEAGMRGEFADLMWTYFFIEMTNPTCLALVERRTSAIIEMDYNFKIIAEDKRKRDFDESLAQDQVEALRTGYEQIDNIYGAIEHLAMATFRMFAHVQMHLDTAGVVRHLELLDQWNFLRDGLKGEWYWNADAASTSHKSLNGEDRIDPDRDMMIVRERVRHVDRPGLIGFIRQNLCEKDWDSFIEIYGIPNPIIIGPPNVPADKEAEYRDAAGDVAEGGSGYLPNGSEVEYPTETRSQSPFEQRLEWLQKQMVLVGTGGMLTMLAESGSGTLAGGAHSDTFKSIARAEAQQISELFQQTLDRQILERDFPGKPRLAYFSMASAEERDIGDIVKHFAELAPHFDLDPADVQERTGYKIVGVKDQKPQEQTVSSRRSGLTNPSNLRDGGAAVPTAASRLSDEAEADRVGDLLLASAREEIAKAQAADLQPLRERLAYVLQMDDPDFQRAALRNLRKDLPAMLIAINADPRAAVVLEQAMGSGLINGWAEGAVGRTAETEAAA